MQQHDHVFGQNAKRPGESRTLIVIVITSVMMLVEISAGIAYGSMALLADGLHMASHAAALAITWCAYLFARRRAHDESFSFGTGKVNALGGYTGATLLAIFAVMMMWESADRFLHPVAIAFNQAIAVGVVGLIVNGLSALILQHSHDHGHQHHHHDHDHDHDHDHRHHDHDHGHEHDHDHGHGHAHDDHNLRAAYLHVLADALTSVLAIFALVTAKYLGMTWLDPMMGVVGALLVARWSWGLIAASSSVLLDRQAPERVVHEVRHALEADKVSRVVDLHVWSIGPGIYAGEMCILTTEARTPAEYKSRIPVSLRLVHMTVEVQAMEAVALGSTAGRMAETT